jgi:hypothetical protein
MTTDHELCFLENYARFSYTGAGRIVDLGCWLGATTLALARGVADNSAVSLDHPIEAFDRFLWEDWMTPIAAAIGVPKTYRAGDDFFADVAELLRPYDAIVRLRKEDLLESEPSDAPVELLFVDAMKSWSLVDKIARDFFPRLIAGRALLVQQDFGYHALTVAGIHLLMWYLRDFFLCVHHVPESCSVVYLHTAPLTRAALPEFCPTLFSLEMIHEAWEHSLRCVRPDAWPAVLVCKLGFLVERGFAEAAHAQARDLLERGHRLPDYMLCEARAVLSQQLNRLPRGSAQYQVMTDTAELLTRCTTGASG